LAVAPSFPFKLTLFRIMVRVSSCTPSGSPRELMLLSRWSIRTLAALPLSRSDVNGFHLVHSSTCLVVPLEYLDSARGGLMIVAAFQLLPGRIPFFYVSEFPWSMPEPGRYFFFMDSSLFSLRYVKALFFLADPSLLLTTAFFLRVRFSVVSHFFVPDLPGESVHGTALTRNLSLWVSRRECPTFLL